MAGQNWSWNARRERAAILLAEDELTDEQIAEQVGVRRSSIINWKQHPEFTMRVAEHVKRLEAEALKFAIAKQRNRIARKQRDWEKLQRLIEARGVEHADEVAGGDTGLLAREERMAPNGRTVSVYFFDRAVLQELRALEKETAQELQQWVEKSAVTVDDAGLSDEERATRIRSLFDRIRQRAGDSPDE